VSLVVVDVIESFDAFNLLAVVVAVV